MICQCGSARSAMISSLFILDIGGGGGGGELLGV